MLRKDEVSLVEKKKMLLSRETLEGIDFTGIATYHLHLQITNLMLLAFFFLSCYSESICGACGGIISYKWS